MLAAGKDGEQHSRVSIQPTNFISIKQIHTMSYIKVFHPSLSRN